MKIIKFGISALEQIAGIRLRQRLLLVSATQYLSLFIDIIMMSHISLQSQNLVTPYFAIMTFWQCKNTCHSGHLLSNFRTSRPIRTPLDLELQAFRQYFGIVSEKQSLDAF